MSFGMLEYRDKKAVMKERGGTLRNAGTGLKQRNTKKMREQVRNSKTPKICGNRPGTAKILHEFYIKYGNFLLAPSTMKTKFIHSAQ